MCPKAQTAGLGDQSYTPSGQNLLQPEALEESNWCPLRGITEEGVGRPQQRGNRQDCCGNHNLTAAGAAHGGPAQNWTS